VSEAVGVGLGGLYLGMPVASAAATPTETLRVSSSESRGGNGMESFCLGSNMIADVSGFGVGAAWEAGPDAGDAGLGVVFWALASAAVARRAVRKLRARWGISLC